MPKYQAPASYKPGVTGHTPILAGDLNQMDLALTLLGFSMSVLVQSGTDYVPVEDKSDIGQPRLFIGALDPSTVSGVTLTNDDIWINVGAGVAPTDLTALTTKVTTDESSLTALAGRVTALENA